MDEYLDCFVISNYCKMHHMPMVRRCGKRKGMSIAEYVYLPFPDYWYKRKGRRIKRKWK